MIVAIVGVLLGVVLLPMILIGNIIGNRGPLFYVQERVGRNRKNFNILKFRTMFTDAELDGARFTVKQDARITAFGNFLRKTRIDEFPAVYQYLKRRYEHYRTAPRTPDFCRKAN